MVMIVKSTASDPQLDPRGLAPSGRTHLWFSAGSMDAGTPHAAPRHATRAVWAAFALLTLYVAFGLTPVGSSLDQSMRAARDDSGTALVWLSSHLLDAVNALTVTTTGLAYFYIRRRGHLFSSSFNSAFSSASIMGRYTKSFNAPLAPLCSCE